MWSRACVREMAGLSFGGLTGREIWFILFSGWENVLFSGWKFCLSFVMLYP